jgi:hypothetical protein
VTNHQQLILNKLAHLERMAGYLEWSLNQVLVFVPIRDWSALTDEQHESLAAFRVRFSEFQEHIGKTMRAIAIEEEENHEPFGAVLAFMEKLGILDSTYESGQHEHTDHRHQARRRDPRATSTARRAPRPLAALADEDDDPRVSRA